MYLGKRGFIYSACGSFTKNWERIRKFKIVGDSWYFYQNELEINKNRYLTLVPTNKWKEKIKKYEKLWSKIKGLIRSITQMKTYMKFNLDDQLSLNKTIEIPGMIIVVRAVFHKSHRYYPQVFLGECLYELWII